MRPWKPFLAVLAVFVTAFGVFGVKRFALGVDFTDEGAYVSWPLRMLYGEPPFTSELMTLTRPVEVFLAAVFDYGPASTLYGLRLTGWAIHIVAFGFLGAYLFQLGGNAVRGLLLAAIPFFTAHILGLAAPAYNVLSSDFFLIALSLRGLATLGTSGPKVLNAGSGVALFLATVCHPGLGAVAAVGLIYECAAQRLIQNLLERNFSAGNTGWLVFLGCWILFAGYLVVSGAAGAWLERLPLIQSFSATAVRDHPLRFVYRLGLYLGSFDRWATALSVGALVLVSAAWFFLRSGKSAGALRAAALLAGLVVAFLGVEAWRKPELMTSAFALVAYLLLAVPLPGRPLTDAEPVPGLRPLLFYSGLAGLVYAMSTFYFTPLRSWMSGALGLPFAFAVGLELLLGVHPLQSRLARTGIALVLAGLVAGLARNHYLAIYRDAAPAQLTAAFALPKLRHIRSTPERVASLDELYAHLHPKIAPGNPLLVFDDCPLLYYLFDAKPVYGLTWAIRYAPSPEGLNQLTRELLAQPLPAYAIRLQVDPSYPVWGAAARIKYENYPLNEMVLKRYELDRTIFPFEVWRKKTDVP